MNDTLNEDGYEHAPPPRRRGWRIAGYVLLGFTLAAFLGMTWLLFTNGGARFALGRAQTLLAPRLEVGTVGGRLAGPLRVTELRWRDPQTGVDVYLPRGEVDIGLRWLLVGDVRIRRANLSGLRVGLTTVPSRETPPSNRHPLQAPVDMRIDAFDLGDALVTRDGEELVHVRTAQVAGAWTGRRLRIYTLDVVAAQGEVHFSGNVNGRRRYRGQGQGRFRWRAGNHELAGVIRARANRRSAELELEASAPLRATLTFQLQQIEPWPWTWRLDVPALDPREQLLPGSSLQRLAAQLEGQGNLDEASVQGRIELNRTPLEVRRLEARREPERLTVTGEIGFGGGRVSLDGAARTAAEPVDGDFVIDWQGIDIPADLVGQALRTEGHIEVSGSATEYGAVGTLQVGPPGRLAFAQLRLRGTPELVQLERFDIVQPQGRLAAAGLITLEPVLGWTLAASARRFDPGAIIEGWPGQLDFRLASNGRMEEEHPVASLALQDLTGTLRERPVAGRADLRVDADRAVTGRAELSSGASRVRVVGRTDPDRGDLLDVVFDVASLGDWLPGGRGSLRGTVQAAGRWPELTMDARLTAADVAYEGNEVRSASLTAHVIRPLQPSGELRLDARGLVAAGLDFESLQLRADGDAQDHRASLDAQGPRLTVGTDVTGSFAGDTWSGTLSRLLLAVPRRAQLSLEQPVTVSWSPARSTLERACLVDGDIRVCAQGEMGPAPRMALQYEIRELPLGLAQGLVDLPVDIDGRLDGMGEIRRDDTGALTGLVQLRSRTGTLYEPALGDVPSRELLAWRDLDVDASLDGDTATVQARGGLNENGTLSLQGSATGLTTAAPAIDGQVEVNLPGLGVVEAFVPQLLNVQGTLSVRARAQGPLDAPQVGGEARLEQLAFELPELGLKPSEGRFVASLEGDGPVRLEGSVKSGDGTLRVTGEAQLSGEARLNVTGENVLAADIPGVRLVITPSIDAQHSDAGLQLGGRVSILNAAVNLQRLPNARRTRSVSPDVVVVDDPDMDAARNVPVRADLDFQVGAPGSENVKITGFGLDATVTGALTVRERPGQPTTASGELRVAGGYQAYGQDLTIQQGRLLFAGTPVDNPRLAITAVREIDAVTAGFRVSGTARNPQLTVFSDPPMGEASALSYIIAGKPLDQIGQGTGEGDALQSAARQLGAAAGGLLARNIGKRLGVDEVGIQESRSVGGAALTVGQYLSPRLYLSYGVGLFEPGRVVTLRYRVSRGLSLEAEQGSLSSRAGVQFRTEK